MRVIKDVYAFIYTMAKLNSDLREASSIVPLRVQGLEYFFSLVKSF